MNRDKTVIDNGLNESTLLDCNTTMAMLDETMKVDDFINLANMTEDRYNEEFKVLFEGGEMSKDLPARWVTYAGGRNRPVRIIRDDGTFYIIRPLIDSRGLDIDNSNNIEYSFVMNNIESEGSVNPIRGNQYASAAFKRIGQEIINTKKLSTILYDSRIEKEPEINEEHEDDFDADDLYL